MAAARYVLRNTLRLALESAEDEDYMHLVEIYSIGCNRLVGLLRVGLGDADRLTVYLREQIERAIQEVGKELKIAGSMGIAVEVPRFGGV